MKTFKDLREGKMSELTDTIRNHIGIINKNSQVTADQKTKAAKNVSKEHGISLDSASKFVNDYCKMKQESVELDESGNPFKRADAVISKIRNKAVVANLKGDKAAEDKNSKRLSKVMDYRNKMLATESFESDKQQLDNHVTNSEPTMGNIVKMHDMVRNIAKTHGVSSNKVYDQVKNNSAAHSKFRDAATGD